MQISPRHSIVMLALGALSACSANGRLLIGEILDDARDGASTGAPTATSVPMTPPSQPMTPPSAESVAVQGILDEYCAGCHDPSTASGGLGFVDIGDLVAQGLVVPGSAADSVAVERMRRREMPPQSVPQPSDTEIEFVAEFVDDL